MTLDYHLKARLNKRVDLKSKTHLSVSFDIFASSCEKWELWNQAVEDSGLDKVDIERDSEAP